MKKLILVVSVVLLLSGCVMYNASSAPSSSSAPSASPIKADEIISFQLSDKTDAYTAEYKANKADLKATLIYGKSEKTDNLVDIKWDKAKWDEFISDVIASGLLDAQVKDYVAGGSGEWSIALTGDFGVKALSGAGSYPPGWQEFKDMLAEYFGEMGNLQ
jgi:hypothetical protein